MNAHGVTTVRCSKCGDVVGTVWDDEGRLVIKVRWAPPAGRRRVRSKALSAEDREGWTTLLPLTGPSSGHFSCPNPECRAYFEDAVPVLAEVRLARRSGKTTVKITPNGLSLHQRRARG